MQLLIEQRKIKDASFLPDRTDLGTTIWSLINDNIRRTYENELEWIKDLRGAIASIPDENDETGTLLQKFTMYHIKSAIVARDINSLRSEFRASIPESSKHDVLRVFENV